MSRETFSPFREKPAGRAFKLAYKIHILVSAVVVIVVAAVVFFALREYKTSMYEQLLRRSFNSMEVVSDRFRSDLWTKTGMFRGMNRKTLDDETPLSNELVYAIEKTFDDIIENDPSVGYFLLYYPAGRLAYPGMPPEKKSTQKKEEESVRRVEDLDATYNSQSGYIEIYRAMLDKEGNPWAWVEMGVSPAIVKNGILWTIWSSVAIAIVCCMAGIVAAVRFAGILLIPIQRLRQTAQSISGGDLSRRADITTTDEIAELAQSFNTMAARLEKRIGDLSALQMLSAQISGQLTQEGLHHVIAQTFGRIANARSNVILVQDEKRGIFSLSAGMGVVESKIEITANSPVISQVMQTRREVLTTSKAAGPLARLFFAEDHPDTASCPFLALPLVVDDHVRGMILLAGVGMKTDADDLTLYRTLGHHTSIAMQNAHLYHLAITDGLTGLYLRRHFLFELERLMNPPADNNRMALLMADLDHFKKINDTYGHPEGDFILVNVAQTLRKTFRMFDAQRAERVPDMVGRYGGEEFIALLRNVDPNQAKVSAERIRAAIENQMFRSEKHAHHITASIGVCPYRPGIPIQDWIDFADQALYRSKFEGRNRVTLYEG